MGEETNANGTLEVHAGSDNAQESPPQEGETQPPSQTDAPEDNQASNNDAHTDDSDEATKPYWKIRAFTGILGLDILISVVFLAPFCPWLVHRAGDHLGRFNFNRSLNDLALCAALRITASFLAMIICYLFKKVPPQSIIPLYKPNGIKKTKEEIEQEALEEPFLPWFCRFIFRPSLTAEIVSVVSQSICIVKCLTRMNLEMGNLMDQERMHPIFWVAIFLTAILAVLEACYLEEACELMGRLGIEQGSPRMLRNISSQLLAPLLDDHNNDEEEGIQASPSDPDDENTPAVSDIGADTDYKANWSDLITMCYPDAHLIAGAFVFLLLAAVAQVYIPRFLGNILDALAVAFANPSDESRHMSMWDVPHFLSNVRLLVAASILAGVFSGLRGSIFDIGFFDMTKTGDISSRLSSDTTLVGDQVSLNVNVFLRSVVQAVGVLVFMFWDSWQLSIVAFISVPLITVFSKWYGNYVRALTKVMQKKLADGNATSEAALGSMATVRAFDAAEAELQEFEESMVKYLELNYRSAVAYFGYATISTSLPQLVFAVVVFFGGMLVRNGDMTSGKLVSFLLYLQSLSDAFSTIGWVFSSLTQAVGAADKVFELMHRKPRLRTPSSTDTAPSSSSNTSSILGIETSKVRHQRTFGLRPETANGEITLENVTMYYPARPNRRVLDNLSLHIKPGSIVALVGQSGGGKSSVMSLIQHLYEPSSGRVTMDGHEVCNLCPEWMSRTVAAVSQEPTLFGRSIKRNIIYGLEGTEVEPTDEEIVEAAKLANAHSFIERMPQEYDTDVGESGVQLSGGQKQRIAIARALVRKPRVLLLDEATSALDAESEHLVQKAIDDMIERGKQQDLNGGKMTVVIVAHRLSTVRSADCIFVIREGQVVEQGTHEELLQDNQGAYTSLIRRQMEAQGKLESHGK